MLNIDVNESASLVKKAQAAGKYRTPVVLDPTGAAAAKYNATGFPTLIIADHKAQILLRSYYVPFDRFDALLEKAVKAAEADKPDDDSKTKPEEGKPEAG